MQNEIREESAFLDFPQTLYNPNTLLLFADDSNQNLLGGLCGQYNGDGTDDFTLPDGTTTTDSAVFAAAWQVKDSNLKLKPTLLIPFLINLIAGR